MTILPVLLGASSWWRSRSSWPERRLDRSPVAAIGMIAVLAAASYGALYRGFSGGLTIRPPVAVRLMDVIGMVMGHIHGTAVRVPVWGLATVVGHLGFCAAPLAGLPAAVAGPIRSWPPYRRLLLAMLIVGLLPSLLLVQSGGSENFFAYYGYVTVLCSRPKAWGRCGGGGSAQREPT